MTRFPALYAIRQVSTGYFMPMSFEHNHKHSRDEPTKDCFPRLFKSKSAAKSALVRWCEGIFGIDAWIEHGERFNELSNTPVPGRNISDMEIVEISIRAMTIKPENGKETEKWFRNGE